MVSFSASRSLILISICTKYSIHEVIFDLHTIELQQALEDGELVEVMSIVHTGTPFLLAPESVCPHDSFAAVKHLQEIKDLVTSSVFR